MAINVERIADLPAKRNIDSGDNMALDNLNGGTKRYAIENLFSITGKATNAAPNYDPTATYSAGDYVVHLGDLFKANQDIDTAEDWTAAHWTAVNVGDEVSDLKGALLNIPRLDTGTDLNNLKTPGTYALHSSKTYQNIPSGEYLHNGFLEVYKEIDTSGTMIRTFQKITFFPVDEDVVIWARYYSTHNDFGWSQWFRVEANGETPDTGIITVLDGSAVTVQADISFIPDTALLEVLPQYASPGTPAIDNIIEFSGHTSGTITNVVKATTETTYTYPYDWSEIAGTVYHGNLDVNSGRFTVDGYLITINGSSDVRTGGSGTSKRFTLKLPEAILIPNDIPVACNMFPCVERSVLNAGHTGISVASDGQTLWFKPEYGTSYYDYTAAQMKAYLGSHPLKVVCRLANQTTYHFESLNFAIRAGDNDLSADCGNLHIVYKGATYDETIGFITKDTEWIFGTDIYVANLKNEYPTYNDDDLLDLAIERATEKGKTTKIIWDGTDIHFSGTVVHNCSGFGGIDFGGSKIYMPSHDGGTIISVSPDEVETVTTTAANITAEKVTDQSLYGKVFALNNNTEGNAGMCLGHRTGSHEESIYWTPTVVTNPDGKFATGDLYLTPSTGNVVCQNVHDYPEVTFDISNGKIIANAGTNMSVFVRCTRSNTHIHDFVLSGASGITSFHYGVFLIRYCAGIEIDGIVGINPVRLPVSGYGIGLFSVTNVHVHDCIIGDSGSWGAVGSNHLVNTVFERCNLNRWDCHYAQCGYNVIRECVLNEIAYGIGNGVLSIEKCELRPDTTSNNDINLVYLRPDLVGAYDGDIIISGCTFRIGDQAKAKLNIWKDGCVFAMPDDSAIDWISEKRRIVRSCQFPDGCNRIFIVGSTETSDQDMYSKITYAVKDCIIDCADSVIDSLSSVQEEVGGIVLDNCDIKTQCYITKALTDTSITVRGCKFGSTTARVIQNSETIRVVDSELSAVVADSASAELIATGNSISGTQSVSNFTKYALSGNVASDMASVNKHSN